MSEDPDLPAEQYYLIRAFAGHMIYVQLWSLGYSELKGKTHQMTHVAYRSFGFFLHGTVHV